MNPELTAIFTNVAKKSSGPLAIIATVGGFLSDVILPLLDLAPWIAGISFLAFVGSVVAFFMFKATPEKELGESLVPASMVLTAGSTIIFAIYAVVFNNAPEKGYLAENVQPIAAVQASLLWLEADVEEIRETTERTEDLVQEIADAQEIGFAELQEAFANLQASDTIIEDPETPQEWYSNARFHQLKGNTAEAVKAYEGYIPFGLEFVDPLQEYANLLNSTQGIGKTRQIFTELYNAQPDNRTLEMLSALLLDSRDDQLTRLEMLATRAPQYAPVFLEIGDAYTRKLQATFTTDSRDKQAAAYGTLFELEGDQQFSSFYIDKSLAQEKLGAAQKTLDAFASADSLKLDFLPINSADSSGNPALLLAVLLPEGNVKEILFSVDDPTPSISTGSTQVGSGSIANTNIGPIPFTEKGDHIIYVQYTDANDVVSEVFTYEYTVNDIMFSHQQEPYDFSLEGSPVFVTLTAIDAAADDLSTWNFSIDSDALDQSFQFPGYIVPLRIPGDLTAADQGVLEPGEHTVYVQRTRPDGSQTDVVSYTFTVNP